MFSLFIFFLFFIWIAYCYAKQYDWFNIFFCKWAQIPMVVLSTIARHWKHCTLILLYNILAAMKNYEVFAQRDDLKLKYISMIFYLSLKKESQMLLSCCLCMMRKLINYYSVFLCVLLIAQRFILFYRSTNPLFSFPPLS